MNEETARERQSRVVLSGGKWEEYVRLYLNEKLQDTGIEVIYSKSEQQIKERSLDLWKRLSMPLKTSINSDLVWGDIDLVAIKKNVPMATISCKLSLHGHFTETLFWSLLFKMLTRIKVVLATPDAGRGGKEWQSEWGPPENQLKTVCLQSHI